MNHMLQNMVKLEILATSPIASSRPIGLVNLFVINTINNNIFFSIKIILSNIISKKDS